MYPSAPIGNDRAGKHLAYSDALVIPRARELAAQVLDANQHLDAQRDGPALARYAAVLARVERVHAWLAEREDPVFADLEAGTVHRCYERLERWERQAADAEHRLAIDPFTRSRLGLVQAQVFDLAKAMSAAGGDGDRD